MWVYKLGCNPDIAESLDTGIENGKAYDVHWFKDTESSRVEDAHKNMWTYYHEGSSNLDTKLSIDVAGNSDFASISSFKSYDLVIFNAQISDSGTYYCKAVSRGDGNTELLGTSTLTVSARK